MKLINRTERCKGTAWLAGAFRAVEELIFPIRCPVCDRPAYPPGALICRECSSVPVRIKDPRCLRCGKQLDSEEKEYCSDCRLKPHFYDRGLALYTYPSCRHMLYRFKYGNRPEYAQFFGRELAIHLGREILSWHPDALVPVPLSKRRLRERGYNQAALTAREIGKQLGIPVREDLVQRIRNTLPLRNLDVRQRQKNLENAFIVCKNDVKLDTIVIIDDIYTTGSTVDEIARILRAAGVSKVYYVSLSIGNGLL